MPEKSDIKETSIAEAVTVSNTASQNGQGMEKHLLQLKLTVCLLFCNYVKTNLHKQK
jgi:hypothetical protein